MRILVVAATDGELATLATAAFGHGHRVDRLVTGVGMVATAIHVSRALALDTYDFAMNVGVCGAFDRSLTLGAVVHITSDRLAELGVEDGETFIPAEVLGLIPANDVAIGVTAAEARSAPASKTLAALPKVSAITVNTVHGSDASIAAVVNRWHPQVESMEGAAFLCACRTTSVPCVQIRAVSNYVERRNRASWKMAEAIEALGRTTTAILNEL